ncbi:hypothetical protein FD754_016651 [Muntiacus muntjak]|uniref:FZ domain-containing protein n=1 Tax=Muntiacus muntjak TaxID=9888 RepID=A0A5N3VRM1_MUNMU|nr:hypothetical protein FD754_016651 [Muntiacus muntjak]
MLSRLAYTLALESLRLLCLMLHTLFSSKKDLCCKRRKKLITACILSMVKQITSPGEMHETSAQAWCTGRTQRSRPGYHCVTINQLFGHCTGSKGCYDLSQQEDNEPPKEYDPGQFAGLLHGSSPACESPENPFHLYGKRDEREEGKDEVSLANSPLPFKQTPIENKSEPVVKKIKPKVVSRTIFHKKSSQLENHTIVGTRTARSGSRNGDQWIVNTGGFVERACTLGRIRSLPKALIDMHLSKNVSKSDSDLIAYPSNEKTSRVNWSESSPADHSSKGNSERTPSFTSEWEEFTQIYPFLIFINSANNIFNLSLRIRLLPFLDSYYSSRDLMHRCWKTGHSMSNVLGYRTDMNADISPAVYSLLDLRQLTQFHHKMKILVPLNQALCLASSELHSFMSIYDVCFAQSCPTLCNPMTAACQVPECKISISLKGICRRHGDAGLIPGSGRCPGEAMATHSSTLARGTEEPGGPQFMGSQKRILHHLSHQGSPWW